MSFTTPAGVNYGEVSTVQYINTDTNGVSTFVQTTGLAGTLIATRIYAKSGQTGVTLQSTDEWAEVTLPNGGDEDQVLAKASNSDGDVEWVTIEQGGGSIDSLDDVDTSTTPPTEGQVLTWDDDGQEWKPADSVGGGATGTNARLYKKDVEYTVGQAPNGQAMYSKVYEFTAWWTVTSSGTTVRPNRP